MTTRSARSAMVRSSAVPRGLLLASEDPRDNDGNDLMSFATPFLPVAMCHPGSRYAPGPQKHRFSVSHASLRLQEITDQDRIGTGFWRYDALS